MKSSLAMKLALVGAVLSAPVGYETAPTPPQNDQDREKLAKAKAKRERRAAKRLAGVKR